MAYDRWSNLYCLDGVTLAEDFLREYYRDYTNKEDLVPIIGKTKKAITEKAGRMGLCNSRGASWTQKEKLDLLQGKDVMGRTSSAKRSKKSLLKKTIK